VDYTPVCTAQAGRIIGSMRTLRRTLIPALLLVGTAVSAQSTTWFPPDLELVFARQLASRLAKLDSVARDEASALASARRVIQNLAGTLGSWRDAEVVERAPLFPEITLPLAKERHIDAMARYQVCSLVLLNQFESGADVAVRRKAALGLTVMTMAVERLRAPYMATRGTDKVLHAFLTSPAMANTLDDVRKKPGLVAHGERQCAPLLQELMFKPGL